MDTGTWLLCFSATKNTNTEFFGPRIYSRKDRHRQPQYSGEALVSSSGLQPHLWRPHSQSMADLTWAQPAGPSCAWVHCFPGPLGFSGRRQWVEASVYLTEHIVTEGWWSVQWVPWASPSPHVESLGSVLTAGPHVLDDQSRGVWVKQAVRLVQCCSVKSRA